MGEEINNPYIRDGDIVIVPALKEKVSITGAINNHGEYELVEGDGIIDIIKLAMGFRENAYSENVEIVRFKENNNDTEILTVNLKKSMKILKVVIV